MTKAKYRKERRAILAKLAEARATRNDLPPGSVGRGVAAHAEEAAIKLMAATRREHYGKQIGAVQRQILDSLADVGRYLKACGVTK